MKKIVCFLLTALCLPWGLMAQSVEDDLYFVPSKNKQEKKETSVRKEQKVTNVYAAPGATTVIVQNRKGQTRNVDEYNRRYEARDNEFLMNNDTLYIKEKARPGLDGEWVTGEFNGTQDDYEYAERIIRFRHPRFAVSIGSPLYWDMVYGVHSWDWNVYTDGLYAYAFPTFSNRLWWDWRFGSHSWNWNYGWGWHHGWGWHRPYYSWSYSPTYWGGWYGGYWGGWYGGGYWGRHHHWYGSGWGSGNRYWSGPTYTNRRSYGHSDYRSSSSVRTYGSAAGRSSAGTVRSSAGSSTYGRSSSRVVGSRSSDERYIRTEGGSTRSGSATYSRPSSTRSSGPSAVYSRPSAGSVVRSSEGATYSRGSSAAPRSTYSREGAGTGSSSYDHARSSSPSRSYSPSSSGSSSRGSYSVGSGGSVRSSGGGGGSAGRGGSRR